MPYRDFRITYRTAGPYASPWRSGAASQWHADTIFGTLCWCYLHREGDEALESLLRRFESSEPPLVISNGFPGDCLPKPLVAPAPFDSGQTLDQLIQEADARKESEKIELLTPEEFQAAIDGKPLGSLDPSGRSQVVRNVRMRAGINRLTGTTTGPDEGASGALFETEETRTERITIYARISPDFVDEARRLFADISHSGIGKGASIGMGAVDLPENWFEEFDGFTCSGRPNGFVSLSNFVPAEKDPVDGMWRVFVKYGKFGQSRSSSAPPGESDAQPFKRPLLMLEAGSVFKSDLVREFYGRMVSGLSRHYPDARQYGLCYSVPCVLGF